MAPLTGQRLINPQPDNDNVLLPLQQQQQNAGAIYFQVFCFGSSRLVERRTGDALVSPPPIFVKLNAPLAEPGWLERRITLNILGGLGANEHHRLLVKF
jgi:hypothetical protein